MMDKLKLCILFGAITLGLVMLKVYKDSSNKSDSEKETEASVKQSKKERFRKGRAQKRRKKVQDQSTDSMKIPRLRPNFFLGFQVSNSEIHKKIKKVQQDVVSRNPLLHSALVKVSTLHVTLAVTHLEGKDHIVRLKEKLDAWADENKKKFFNEPITLNFTGIKTFDNSVAYVDMEKCQNYERICHLSKNLNELLLSSGFMTDAKEFTPHLTILKLSKAYWLVKSKKKFKSDFEFLKEHSDHFGEQVVQSVQLLNMMKKDEKGYYECCHQIFTSDVESEMDHTDCCTPIPKPTPDDSSNDPKSDPETE